MNKLLHFPHKCNVPAQLYSLHAGSNVEGGVIDDDDVSTETPLQLASAAGKLDIVELLLSFGASPFLSTLKVDTMAFGSSAQKGIIINQSANILVTRLIPHQSQDAIVRCRLQQVMARGKFSTS